MLKLIIMITLIVCAGFQNDGISGVLTNFKTLATTLWEMLGLLNIFSVNVIGDGILTEFFKHYIVYAMVGLIFELFNIKKGTFGKIFGKTAYWIIGIPVSFILNWLSNLLF